MGTQTNIDPVSDEGELYSDDEESAYYPHKTKTRSSHQRTIEVQDVHQTRWSAPNPYKQSSPSKSKGYGDRYRQSSPDSDQSGSTNESHFRGRRKRDRSESSDKESESFFEDRDGSDCESKERRNSRERQSDNRSPGISRSSDHYDSPGSRDPDGKRDYRSSPSYNRYGNQDRDNSSVANESDTSHHHYQRNYSWSRRGGYSPSYQQGHTRYGGRARGGYGYKRFPSNQISTGMTSREFHTLASQVVRRKEQGLSLLPAPRAPRYTHIDLSSYPPAPEWYMRDLQFCEKVKKKQESLSMRNNETVPPVAMGHVPSLFPPGIAPMGPVVPIVATTHFSPALPPAIVPPPLFNQAVALGSQAAPESYLSRGSGGSCSIVQESAHTFPSSVPDDNPPISENSPISQVDIKSVPLDANMPFAQPLPSAYHTAPFLPSQTDRQPLNPTKENNPSHLSLPIDSDSTSSVNKLLCTSTPTTPSKLTISMQPSELTNSVPPMESNNLPTDTPVNEAMPGSLSNDAPSGGSVVGTSTCMTGSDSSLVSQERSMSVSSEVKMEIDALDKDSS